MKEIFAINKGHQKLSGSHLLVIVVSWNTKPLLRKCLESLRMCRPCVTYEVVVVDNASTDGSGEMVEAEFPEWHLVQSEENVGFAKANNFAFKLFPQYAYYLLLNSDASVTPDIIRDMLYFLESHSHIAAVGPALKLPTGQYQPGGAGWGPKWIYSLNTFLMLSNITPLCRGIFIFQKHYRKRKEPVMVDWLAGACMLIRGQALENVGLFDERYFVYGEDADWCWRAREKGWKIAYLPYVSATHYFRGSAVSNNDWENPDWFRNLIDAVRLTSNIVNYRLFLLFGILGYSLRVVVFMPLALAKRGSGMHARVKRYVSLLRECVRLLLLAR